MLRVAKLTDYATVVMTALAEAQAVDESVVSAQDLAERAHLEAPTVSKLLKQLAQSQLVESFRGVNGGYRLARPSAQVTLADIVIAMEGPFGMTECSAHVGACDHESHCGVRGNWRRVSDVIETTLREITLAQMCRPLRKRVTIPVRLATA